MTEKIFLEPKVPSLKRAKKVAFVGNMNNNFFTLARLLRDRGIDADLLIFSNEPAHFHPINDTFDADSLSFCHKLDWGWLDSFAFFPAAKIRCDLDTYDVIIGTGWAPAFADKIGRPLDFFLSSGGDIFEDTQFRFVEHVGRESGLIKRLSMHWHFYKFVRAQRRGLAGARHILSANAKSRKLVRKFGFKGPFADFLLPVVYTKLYCPENLPKFIDRFERISRTFPTIKTPYQVMKRARNEHFPVVFHHSRQLWKGAHENPSFKGNDRLVRGFARFVKEHPEISPCLIMLRYGPDVQATEQLVCELGIERNVVWLPLLPRREIMTFIGMSDIVAAEFYHTWALSGVVLEALAMAKPLMCFRDETAHGGYYPDWYQVMNVHDEFDIAKLLSDFIARPGHYVAMGDAGRRWQDHYLIKQSIEKLITLLALNGQAFMEGGK